jgi:CDP-glycerol glycerophosphotransferase (TagB/SpsB family)
MMIERKISFYKKLESIPNVKLISPIYPIRSLIKESLGVITLTSTTGFEAILEDRPLFVFGNVFYNAYDYAFKCCNYDTLHTYFLEALRSWERTSIERENNRKCFIYACLMSLKDGNLNDHCFDLSVLEQSNMQSIANSILNTIEQIKENINIKSEYHINDN